MSPLDNLQTGAGATAGSFETSSSYVAALCPLFPRSSGVLVAGGQWSPPHTRNIASHTLPHTHTGNTVLATLITIVLTSAN